MIIKVLISMYSAYIAEWYVKFPNIREFIDLTDFSGDLIVAN